MNNSSFAFLSSFLVRFMQPRISAPEEEEYKMAVHDPGLGIGLL